MKQADGSIRTEEVRIDGPIQLFLTTTASAVADAELENRCIKLTVDEDAAQTAAIHAQQRARDTWDGLALRDAAAAIQRRHRNAQRLLQPVTVINPYAPQLTFATDQARLRRDHRKYLDLIKAITFLHQYQRPRETRTVNGRAVEAVITTPADIRLANDLAHVVLGRCLDDLPPQARRLLGLLWDVVQPWAGEAGVSVAEFPVTTRQLLPHMPYGLSQLRSHLAVLVDQEYVLSFRRHAAEPVRFQLVGDERPDGRSHVCLGLLDPATIHAFDQTPPDKIPTPPARCRIVTGPLTGRNRIEETAKTPTKNGVNGHSRSFNEKEHGRPIDFCNNVAVVGGR